MKNNNDAQTAQQPMTYGAAPGTHTPAKIVKGDNLMLFDENKKSIAYATSHSFSMSCETVDVSSKDHAEFAAVEAGKINWEISADHLFTSAGYHALFTKMIAREPITVYWGNKSESNIVSVGENPTVANGGYENWTPAETGEGVLYTGKVIITSLEASADTGAKATFSVTLQGVGDIVPVVKAFVKP